MNSSVFGSDSQPGLTLLATGRQDCSDLHSWGPGVRPVYIIHYILRGQGFIDYHKKTFPVHTGESFLIYPYDTIRYYPDPGNPWEYTWVEFTGKKLPLCSIRPPFPLPRPSVPRSALPGSDSFLPICSPSTFITRTATKQMAYSARCSVFMPIMPRHPVCPTLLLRPFWQMQFF